MIVEFKKKGFTIFFVVMWSEYFKILRVGTLTENPMYIGQTSCKKNEWNKEILKVASNDKANYNIFKQLIKQS